MRACLPIALAAAMSLPVPVALADTLTYVNDRFGTTVTFPAEVFSEQMEPPDNGDGMTWRSADGASLSAFGARNVLGYSPQDLADQASASEGRTDFEVTYSRVGPDWVVLSGMDDGQVFYTRLELGADDVIHTLQLKYPPALKSAYDALVGPIAGSLGGP